MSARRVSIVGSRRIDHIARHAITACVRELVSQQITVVSGLALGSDITAARATLAAGGNTIAVLPCGIDIITPGEHTGDAEKILVSGGALISGFSPNQPPSRDRYLARNQSIAAISELMIVAAADSLATGSGAAARRAMKLGVKLGALPGTPGTDALIANGDAVRICSQVDLRNLLVRAH